MNQAKKEGEKIEREREREREKEREIMKDSESRMRKC